ncbi:MAG: bacillithiol transferase BstA [Candidatus Acidiferrum sp.]
MDPRYPIGKYSPPKDITPELRADAIAIIAASPSEVRAAVKDLTDAQLETPYRDQGWTVRQVVHHLADSHMNAYIRWRLALTETEPTIKPYDEGAWAKLEDAAHAPVEISLQLLESLHERWVRLLRSLKAETFAKTFRHPEHGVRTLDWLLFLYAWHGRHHTAHITELGKHKGWK